MSYIGSPAAAGLGMRSAPQHLFTYGNVGPVTAIIDCLVIVAASVAAGVAYHMMALGVVGDIAAFAGVGSNTALLFVLLARSRGMYRPTALLWASQWRRIVACWVAVLLAMVAFLFLLKVGASFSRGATIGFGILAPCLLLLSRAAIAGRLRSALAHGRIAAKRAIMVGEREELDHRSATDLLRKYAIREVGRFELPQAGGDDRSLTADSAAVLDAAVDVARTGQTDIVLLALRWTEKDRYDLVRERLRALPLPVVLPLHPRTRARLEASGLYERLASGVRLVPPLGYVDFMSLVLNAAAVLTDSGGVQKEAYLAGVPCVTIRPNTEWVETVEAGWNELVDLDVDRALAALERTPPPERPPLYGDGQAGARVVEALERWARTAATTSSA